MVVNHNNLFQCNRHYWEVPFWKLFIQGVSESTFIPSSKLNISKASGLVHEKGATNTPLSWSGYIILQLFPPCLNPMPARINGTQLPANVLLNLNLLWFFATEKVLPHLSVFLSGHLWPPKTRQDQSQRIGVYGETSVARRYIFRSQTLPTSPVSFWFVVSNGLKQ